MMVFFSLNFCGTNVGVLHVRIAKCGSIPKLIHPLSFNFVETTKKINIDSIYFNKTQLQKIYKIWN